MELKKRLAQLVMVMTLLIGLLPIGHAQAATQYYGGNGPYGTLVIAKGYQGSKPVDPVIAYCIQKGIPNPNKTPHYEDKGEYQGAHAEDLKRVLYRGRQILANHAADFEEGSLISTLVIENRETPITDKRTLENQILQQAVYVYTDNDRGYSFLTEYVPAALAPAYAKMRAIVDEIIQSDPLTPAEAQAISLRLFTVKANHQDLITYEMKPLPKPEPKPAPEPKQPKQEKKLKWTKAHQKDRKREREGQPVTSAKQNSAKNESQDTQQAPAPEQQNAKADSAAQNNDKQETQDESVRHYTGNGNSDTHAVDETPASVKRLERAASKKVQQGVRNVGRRLPGWLRRAFRIR